MHDQLSIQSIQKAECPYAVRSCIFNRPRLDMSVVYSKDNEDTEKSDVREFLS